MCTEDWCRWRGARRYAGIRHYSVDALFHILRWEIAIKTRGEEEFRLNNNFTAFYARLISDREPDLKDFFTLRERRAK
jgi:hypothetical protein